MGRDTALKVINNYRYEVDINNVVEIWNNELPDELDRPFIRQPSNPTGKPWGDAEEASKWAEDFIDHLLNPPTPVDPVIE